MEAAIAVRKRENMVLEVVIDGVPYAEEAYVKDPIQYLATEYGAKYIKATRKPVKDICRFAQKHAEELDSISFVCRYEDKERLYTSLDKEIPNIYVTSSVPNLMEVGHIDAGKGKTLLWLLKKLEISTEEAMAFGDADNDYDMTLHAGVGVVMGNGSEMTKSVADYVTGDNDHDGIGVFIEKYLLD